MAPQHSAGEIEELRRSIVAIFEEEKDRMDKEKFVIREQVISKYVCKTCGNRTQELFTLDGKSGDVICMGTDGNGCGAVVEDHKMHEGTAWRTFEGEEDKNHHGPPPNKLYSASHNMRTNVAAVLGVAGSKGKAAKLRQTAEQVELGLSNLGRKDERRTREGYKDAQKKKAFDLIAHGAMNLNLHGAVVERASELFAAYRDAKEAVHKFNAVVCACVLQAAEDNARHEALEQLQGPDAFVPAVTSRRAALLQQPLAALKRQRDDAPGPGPEPGPGPGRPTSLAPSTQAKKPKKSAAVRVSRAWALSLHDLDGLPASDD